MTTYAPPTGPELIADLVSRLGKPAGQAKVDDNPWLYKVTRGAATLQRGDDCPLLRLGFFRSEDLAQAACRAHWNKARRGLENLGKPVPPVFFS